MRLRIPDPKKMEKKCDFPFLYKIMCIYLYIALRLFINNFNVYIIYICSLRKKGDRNRNVVPILTACILK